MHQGNWKCSKCGAAITELPFIPRSENGLTCRDCYFKAKNGGAGAPAPTADTSSEPPPYDPTEGEVAGEPAPAPPDELDGAVPATGQRKMFTGEWTCSVCGNPITQLPFQPRDTSNLKCLDCFKKG